jgi:hypothetical protein
MREFLFLVAGVVIGVLGAAAWLDWFIKKEPK